MRIEDIPIKVNSALIIVDMQNDFLPGGALAVPKGDEIISGINKLGKLFSAKLYPVIFTQDWHPKNHKSFASSYSDKNPGDPIEKPGLGPILWPDHCVQGSNGAQISQKVNKNLGVAIVRKGYHPSIDSYSAFYDNDKKTKTGLTGLLKDLEIENVYICGLALDYCCYYTAIDAKKEGFNVFFVKDLTRGIDEPENNISNALNSMEEKGITILLN